MCVCIHDGILLSEDKTWNFVILRKMDGPGKHHVRELSQEKKDNGCLFSLMRKINPNIN
jgi:hypothetical protein